jgi:hypothetical protein
MLGRIVLGLCLAAACSKREVPNSSPVTSQSPAPIHLPVVPDAITSQLGAVTFAMAIDLSGTDLGWIARMLPEPLACARDLVTKLRVVVLAKSDRMQGFVTGLALDPTRACIGQLAPAMGFAAADRPDGTYEIQISDQPVSLRWSGDMLVITEGGKSPTSGGPPSAITELLSRVPPGAKAWIASSGFPDRKIKSMIGWFLTSTEHWTLTLTAEGTEPDAARSWVDDMVAGFKEAAAGRGVAVDDKWFAIESTKTTTKLVATLPVDMFDKK